MESIQDFPSEYFEIFETENLELARFLELVIINEVCWTVPIIVAGCCRYGGSGGKLKEGKPCLAQLFQT